ncbi:MAG: glycosyltransferase [Verrucomicrobia bacterium]|jgi:L-malate glycosyltransferase|nr:glycosyltransferase [Verrucomicrobiota bacterium]
MPAIHQFVAGFTGGDAISNESIMFRDIFRGWGYVSEIFSEDRCTQPIARKHVRDVSCYADAANPEDIVLLHLSIGSRINDVFKALPCKKAILYHNVTPSNYFEVVNKQTAGVLRRGREQVADLANCAAVNMADSRFNASELESLGYRDVTVLPLVLNFSMLTHDIDSRMRKKLCDGKKNILFVGRCTPNKKIEDLLRVFAYYQKTIEPNSRLIHVGSHAGSERYFNLLTTMAKELDLRHVKFAGTLTQPELNACYASADAFLCMSEHEGFCIPLIESMQHEVPILAHASAAVPETLDGSGILLTDRRIDLAAELLDRLISNSNLHDAVVKQQSERLVRYRERDLEAEIKQNLSPLLPS